MNIDLPALRLLASYDQPWACHWDHLFTIDLSDTPAPAATGREIKTAAWLDPEHARRDGFTAATEFAMQFIR